MLKSYIFTSDVWQMCDLVAQHRGGLQFLAAGETLEASLVISPSTSGETLSIVDGLLTLGTHLLLQACLHHAALQPLSSQPD